MRLVRLFIRALCAWKWVSVPVGVTIASFTGIGLCWRALPPTPPPVHQVVRPPVPAGDVLCCLPPASLAPVLEQPIEVGPAGEAPLWRVIDTPPLSIGRAIGEPSTLVFVMLGLGAVLAAHCWGQRPIEASVRVTVIRSDGTLCE